MIFKEPWVLLLFPVIVVVLYFLRRRVSSSSIRFSSQALVSGGRPTLKLILSRNLFYLRIAVILLFVLALARPRVPLDQAKVRTEGIDIILTIDCSGSMLAEDFKIGSRRQNRLEVVKKVVENFIKERRNDRIGIVAFAARAYTVCPLTLDHPWLIKNLERIKIGEIEDGTAVGSAVASSLNRLKDNGAKSKIIILLTDGINNAGRISPLKAAEAANALGVKIYTIGAGTKGLALYPTQGLWGETVYQRIKIEIDEDMLKEVARISGGKYFRATDTKSLEEIYNEIDSLEKTSVEEMGFHEYRELFTPLVMLGLILLMVEMLLSNTILRKLP